MNHGSGTSYGTSAAVAEAPRPDSTTTLLNEAIGIATDIEVGTRIVADTISGSIPASGEEKLKQVQAPDLNSQLRVLIRSLRNTSSDLQRTRNGLGA